jgi:hypothetical protein
MVRWSRVAAAILAILVVVGIAGCAQPGQEQAAAASSDDEIAILDRLRAVARAASAVGRAQGAAIFAGVQIDAPSRTVSIFLTDVTQQDGFLAEMRQVDTVVDLGPARFKLGDYTVGTLTAAADKLMRSQQPPDLFFESVAIAPDGRGLIVRAFDAARARQRLDELAGEIGPIPIVIEVVIELTNLSR